MKKQTLAKAGLVLFYAACISVNFYAVGYLLLYDSFKRYGLAGVLTSFLVVAGFCFIAWGAIVLHNWLEKTSKDGNS